MFDNLTELIEKIHLGEDATIELKKHCRTEIALPMKSPLLPMREVAL